MKQCDSKTKVIHLELEGKNETNIYIKKYFTQKHLRFNKILNQKF